MKNHLDLRTYMDSIAHVDEKFWTSLKEVSKTITLKKGEIYASMGERVKVIGFLMSGIIRIYYLDDKGNEWNKAFLEHPTFLLSNIDYEAKAEVYFEALIECNIIQAPISFFAESSRQYPNLQKVYQHELGKLFKRKSEREVSFMNLTAKERYLKFGQSYPNLLNIIPQYHIASYLGITPTQLSRIKLSIQNQHM